MIRQSFVAIALTTIASCATAADPVAQGAHLMAQMKAASGGAKLDAVTTYHLTATHVVDGKINGASESWGDYRTGAYAVVETFGGATTRGGFDGAVSWTLGPDGAVRVGATPEAKAGAKINAYLNSQAYFWPERFPAKFEYQGKQEANGKTYEVVAVTPEGSPPINLWLDPKTRRLARLTGTNGQANFAGEVQTERNVDGVWMMDTGLQTMVAGTETHTKSHDLVTFAFEAVPPDRFTPPK